MAALTITPASVKAGANATIERGVSAVAVTAGQVAYIAVATGKYGLTDADSATPEVRVVKGIALHAAAADQPLAVQTKGLITIGATVAPGVPYFASATPGGIAPAADNTTGVYPTFLGFGISATVIDLNIVAAGVAVG